MERALALLAAHAAPRLPPGDEALLVSPALPRSQRIFVAALSLALAPRGDDAAADSVPVDLRDEQVTHAFIYIYIHISIHIYIYIYIHIYIIARAGATW